ncbi:hypothetical protein AMTRI_Chr08g163330 [Amborella trichopoda]|uniref:putative transporter arsB isoform X2 n=1 Tax=Amborella trichopoda TaxID=13333 RepID=UPI0009C11CF1|nr:putative transporter arsB isoform X2 [Amborella trichopoda]|eukprot:XP_020525637.1 putative transporter arsB isoform X2 [Amborella trichopoda]
MALENLVGVVLGTIAFSVFWVLAVFPVVPFLPIGRTAGSLLGAMLMVIFQVITPAEAYSAIDLPILGFLFGTMVLSVYLERADMFKCLGKLLSWKSKGGRDLLLRICLISAIFSALFTNDTCCVVLTEFVLKIARQNNLPPRPFLLALASSANIGSSATPIGNPQNLVIAVQSSISFGDFLKGIIPAMLIGTVVNGLILSVMFWKILSIEMDEEGTISEVITEEAVKYHRFSPATMSHVTSSTSQDFDSMLEGPSVNSELVIAESLRDRMGVSDAEIMTSRMSASETDNICVIWSGVESETMEQVGHIGQEDGVPARKSSMPSTVMNSLRKLCSDHSTSDETEGFLDRWEKVIRMACVYLVTIGMLVALVMGINMSWTAISAAIALVVLDFKDARPCLEKVSYSLLVFFCGMFITVNGFDNTGIPGAFWDVMEPHARIDSIGGVAVLAVVIVVLSNVTSNVPTEKKMGKLLGRVLVLWIPCHGKCISRAVLVPEPVPSGDGALLQNKSRSFRIWVIRMITKTVSIIKKIIGISRVKLSTDNSVTGYSKCPIQCHFCGLRQMELIFMSRLELFNGLGMRFCCYAGNVVYGIWGSFIYRFCERKEDRDGKILFYV